jgi:hypothetical protein
MTKKERIFSAAGWAIQPFTMAINEAFAAGKGLLAFKGQSKAIKFLVKTFGKDGTKKIIMAARIAKEINTGYKIFSTSLSLGARVTSIKQAYEKKDWGALIKEGYGTYGDLKSLKKSFSSLKLLIKKDKLLNGGFKKLEVTPFWKKITKSAPVLSFKKIHLNVIKISNKITDSKAKKKLDSVIKFFKKEKKNDDKQKQKEKENKDEKFRAVKKQFEEGYKSIKKKAQLALLKKIKESSMNTNDPIINKLKIIKDKMIQKYKNEANKTKMPKITKNDVIREMKKLKDRLKYEAYNRIKKIKNNAVNKYKREGTKFIKRIKDNAINKYKSNRVKDNAVKKYKFINRMKDNSMNKYKFNRMKNVKDSPKKISNQQKNKKSNQKKY